MSKITVNAVAEVLKKNQLDPALLRQVIEELNLLAAPEPGTEQGPAVKKQFVFVLADRDRLLPATDFAGWVLQIPEDESPATVLSRIHRAAYDFNASKRGRIYPCRTIGETLEHVPAKFFKEADAWVKTKEPILVIRTDNIVPGTDNQIPLPTEPATDEAASQPASPTAAAQPAAA